MNEQIPNTNIPVNPVLPTNKFNDLKNKVFPVINNLISKLKETSFYKNKKIFWLVTGVLGLLVLTLIIGLIFGNRGTKKTTISKLPTPTPIVQNTPKAGDVDTLTGIENNLNTLNNQINALDINQSRLKPPSLNFDVKF